VFGRDREREKGILGEWESGREKVSEREREMKRERKSKTRGRKRERETYV
jgi:hypothetical protein